MSSVRLYGKDKVRDLIERQRARIERTRAEAEQRRVEESRVRALARDVRARRLQDALRRPAAARLQRPGTRGARRLGAARAPRAMRMPAEWYGRLGERRMRKERHWREGVPA